MNAPVDVTQHRAEASSKYGIIDCDVHPSVRAQSDLYQFMPKRWQEHLQTYGSHLRTPYIGTTPYPRSSPLIARRDAWPPTGGPPGSDLAFMRQQHLDPLDIEFGILQVLDVREKKSDRRKLNEADVFSRYLTAVEQAASAVDKILDSGTAGS